MRKNSGPPLQITVPELAGCDRCRQTGVEKPFLYEMVCDGCGGSGRVNKDTGERVQDDIMLVAMRKEISRLQGVIADLKRKDPEECPIYGPLKRRGNGTWRGD